MAHSMLLFQHLDHLHMGRIGMLLEDGEPMVNRVTILRLNRGKVALRASYFVTHRTNLGAFTHNPVNQADCAMTSD